MTLRSNSLIANLFFQDSVYFISLVCADAISPLINLFGLNVYPFMPGKKQTNAWAIMNAAAGEANKV